MIAPGRESDPAWRARVEAVDEHVSPDDLAAAAEIPVDRARLEAVRRRIAGHRWHPIAAAAVLTIAVVGAVGAVGAGRIWFWHGTGTRTLPFEDACRVLLQPRGHNASNLKSAAVRLSALTDKVFKAMKLRGDGLAEARAAIRLALAAPIERPRAPYGDAGVVMAAIEVEREPLDAEQRSDLADWLRYVVRSLRFAEHHARVVDPALAAPEFAVDEMMRVVLERLTAHVDLR